MELGEGIRAACVTKTDAMAAGEKKAPEKADLSSLTSMLQARWKSGGAASPKAEPMKAGQVRSFRIVALDAENKAIQVEMA